MTRKVKRLAKNSNEYDKIYKRAYRGMKNADSEEGLIAGSYDIKFGTKKVSPSKFKKVFKDKIKDANQQNMFNYLMDLMDLITTAKQCLEEEGVYIVTKTGQIKNNPAQKELRENLKAFNSMFDAFVSTFAEEQIDLTAWLDD